MNTRSRSTKTASRLVDDKHPLRALMKADLDPDNPTTSKGFLTPMELKNVLDQVFCVVLDDDEIKRIMEQVACALACSNAFRWLLHVWSSI